MQINVLKEKEQEKPNKENKKIRVENNKGCEEEKETGKFEQKSVKCS